MITHITSKSATLISLHNVWYVLQRPQKHTVLSGKTAGPNGCSPFLVQGKLKIKIHYMNTNTPFQGLMANSFMKKQAFHLLKYMKGLGNL